MRTAALPNFRKLYRKLDKTQDKMFENGLPKGDYLLEVQYSKKGFFDFDCKYYGQTVVTNLNEQVWCGRRLNPCDLKISLLRYCNCKLKIVLKILSKDRCVVLCL